MEIGHYTAHNVIFIPWSYDYLSTCVQSSQSVAIQICKNLLQRISGCHLYHIFCIRFPLIYVQLILCSVRISGKFRSYLVQALKRAHRCCAYCYRLAAMIDKFLYSLTLHYYIFGMHLVSADILALHRLEIGRASCRERVFLPV